jgi:hypothetical protein
MKANGRTAAKLFAGALALSALAAPRHGFAQG